MIVCALYPHGPDGNDFVDYCFNAKPDRDRRYALHNNQLTVHYLDGRIERRVLLKASELSAVLEDVFCLNLETLTNLDLALQQVVESFDSK